MKKSIIKLLVLSLFAVFFIAFIIDSTGYYEYSLYNKKNLTEEEIKRFESDVKMGKEIDINDYLSDREVDYSNKLTKTTTNISLSINKYLKNRFRDVFRAINRMVEE